MQTSSTKITTELPALSSEAKSFLVKQKAAIQPHEIHANIPLATRPFIPSDHWISLRRNDLVTFFVTSLSPSQSQSQSQYNLSLEPGHTNSTSQLTSTTTTSHSASPVIRASVTSSVSLDPVSTLRLLITMVDIVQKFRSSKPVVEETQVLPQEMAASTFCQDYEDDQEDVGSPKTGTESAMKAGVAEENALQQRYDDGNDAAKDDDGDETEDDEKSMPSSSVIKTRASPVRDLPTSDPSPPKTFVPMCNAQQEVPEQQTKISRSIVARERSAVPLVPTLSKHVKQDAKFSTSHKFNKISDDEEDEEEEEDDEVIDSRDRVVDEDNFQNENKDNRNETAVTGMGDMEEHDEDELANQDDLLEAMKMDRDEVVQASGDRGTDHAEVKVEHQREVDTAFTSSASSKKRKRSPVRQEFVGIVMPPVATADDEDGSEGDSTRSESPPPSLSTVSTKSKPKIKKAVSNNKLATKVLRMPWRRPLPSPKRLRSQR